MWVATYPRMQRFFQPKIHLTRIHCQSRQPTTKVCGTVRFSQACAGHNNAAGRKERRFPDFFALYSPRASATAQYVANQRGEYDKRSTR